MSNETPQTSLPQRTWIAKFTPETLQAYLSNPDPSSQLRRSNTVWSDDFDNIIGPLSPSDNQKSWSRRELCKQRRTALPFDHNEHSHGNSNLLVHGPRPTNMLFTDDCFVDGLVEGFGIMVASVVVLGAIASLVWLIGLRFRACRSILRCRCSSSNQPLLGPRSQGWGAQSEAVVFREKV